MTHESEFTNDVLKPQKIVDTIHRLQKRIGQRFPDSGLFRVCGQLHDISENMKKRAQWIGQPVQWLRILGWIICATIVIGTILLVVSVYYSTNIKTGVEELTMLEAGINCFVAIGASIFFFLTLETRYKRQRALKAIHELRTIAHIIDMHQLTKDPHRIQTNRIYAPTDLSPKMEMTHFQLRRYLDYCSEMLSLTGKIGAVYVQAFDDGVALASASELEALTTGLSSKIWQKIFVLDSAKDCDDDPQRIQTS